MMEKIIKEGKIKYLHLLNVDEPKFSKWIVDSVKNKNYFNEDEWGYVTPHENVYDILIGKGAKNVFLEKNSKTIIDDYTPFIELMFVHAWDESSILKIKTRSLKKCVWRTWGHDVYQFVPIKGFAFHAIKHNIMAFLRRKKAKNILAIGIANVVDEVKIKSVFGNKIRLFTYPYTAVDNLKQNILEEKQEKRILIGHSMYPSEYHLDVLENLKCFKDENLKIILVAVYGYEEYGLQVFERAKELFGDKVERITERVPLEKYIDFLNTIDVAILSNKQSAALGTLNWLTRLNKKVYVYNESDLAKGFAHIGCEVNQIENIKNQTFEDFLAYDNETSELMKKHFGNVFTQDECCEKILTIINEVKS